MISSAASDGDARRWRWLRMSRPAAPCLSRTDATVAGVANHAARRATARTLAVAAAAADAAHGDATSARSARLNRHFARNARRAPARELRVRAIDRRLRPSSTSSRDRRGQLGARQREAQAVAGHRIDEAGRVAGQQQSGLARRAAHPPPSGPSIAGGSTARASAKRADSAGSACRYAVERSRRRRASGGIALRVRHDQAGVGQSARHRRDADVVAAPHVHLAERRHAGDVRRNTRRSPSAAGAAAAATGRGRSRGASGGHRRRSPSAPDAPALGRRAARRCTPATRPSRDRTSRITLPPRSQRARRPRPRARSASDRAPRA